MNNKSAKARFYHYVFLTNVLRLLRERGMTKKELSELSGVSISFLSDLTAGQANPSLKTMEEIAQAFDVPLPILLESSDWREEQFRQLAGVPLSSEALPYGYECVTVILSAPQAFIVKKWADDAKKQRERQHAAKEVEGNPPPVDPSS